MRKVLFLFIAVLAFSCSSDDGGNTTNPEVTNPESVVQCDKIYVGNVVLSTQQEVDDFASGNYCQIKGNLYIGTRDVFPEGGGAVTIESDIISLAGLSSLKSISGTMNIFHNDYLNSLEGLHNIVEANWSINISYNKLLASLHGLNSLKFIHNGKLSEEPYLEIGNNESLVTLEGIGPIEKMGHLRITENRELLNLKGLESLKKITIMLEIHSNEKMQNLEGLNNLQSSMLNVITSNERLTTIAALGNLEEAISITLFRNFALINLKGLEKLTKLASLDVTSNNDLASLEGVQNLKSISNLIVSGNDSLLSLEHLSGIRVFAPIPDYLENKLEISANNALTSLNGLQNLNVFTGEMIIWGNQSLTNLCALQSIFTTGVFVSPATISQNAYNPTKEDIMAGNCSQ